jgi:hypothetical protein
MKIPKAYGMVVDLNDNPVYEQQKYDVYIKRQIERNIESMHWHRGELSHVMIDFLNNENSNDYLKFVMKDGELISENENLKLKLVIY